MNDRSILEEIEHLAEEERTLRDRAGGDGLSNEEQVRLQHLEVSLDQCWDLLRQRRARREFGQNPNDVEIRDPDTVENYKQ